MLQVLLPSSTGEEYVYHLQLQIENFHRIYHLALNHGGILKVIHRQQLPSVAEWPFSAHMFILHAYTCTHTQAVLPTPTLSNR